MYFLQHLSLFNLLYLWKTLLFILQQILPQNYNIATTPLYFVRSGFADVSYGRFRLSGIYGWYWPSTSTSWLYTGATRPSAFFLHFDNTDVNTSNGPSNRWYGIPLRCQTRNLLLFSGWGNHTTGRLDHQKS